MMSLSTNHCRKWGELLYSNEDTSTGRQLLSLQFEKDLAERAAPYLNSLKSPDADNWRSFLNPDYLSSLDEDGELITSEIVSDTASDYLRDLAVDYSMRPVLQDFNQQILFRECGDDQHNFILDASNSLLDHTAFLAAAIENWRLAETTLPGNLVQLSSQIYDNPTSDFWNQVETFSHSDITAVYNYVPVGLVRDEYLQNRSSFYELIAQTEALKAGMSRIGSRREKLLRLQSAGTDSVTDELRPLTENISVLEDNIERAQNDWQMLIDGTGRYKSLETEYSDCYKQTQESLQLLNKTKHEYSIARSIYEYASAGYLGIDDDSFTQEAAEAVTDGDVVIEYGIDSGETSSGQNNQAGLLETINRVSPAGRLEYVDDKLIRAAAAYDALSKIINDNKENYSVYANDQVYKTCFDEYLNSFRESLVLNKINLVLNKAISKQEVAVRDAFSDWNTAVTDSYEPVEYLDESGAAVIPDGLEGLYLQRVEGGNWNISWGAVRDRHDAAGSATAEAYFKPNPDNEDRQSLFSKDLIAWLEKISLRQKEGTAEGLFKTWALACKWEEYGSLSSTDTDQLTDSFWSEYLNKNNEEDLDKSGARLLLENEWENAYNKVNSSTGENLWMYNFYKLLAKSGAMQVDTTAGGGRAEEDLGLLADEESIILANQYMAEKYHEGADALIIASIPMFAIAAIYFAIGASLLNPITWVAAAGMFAIAVAFTLGGAAKIGEGNAKHAAANQIEKHVINKSNANISRFLSDFKQNTNGILEKKKKYENELCRLLEMQGAADNKETLTDEQRIYMLQASVVDAFNDDNEDLHRLLYQAGFAAAEGSDTEDLNIIAALFSVNQDRMSISARNDCADSNSFIAALEAESQAYKQTMALGLNSSLTGPDGAAHKQIEAENSYERAYYSYIKGEISLEDFNTAAESAWKNPQFSTREHILRLYEQQSAIAEMILGSDKLNSRISEELLESQKVLLTGSSLQQGVYDYRMQNYRDVKLFEMQMKRLEMVESRKLWENQMSAITARGELEWSASERKFNRNFKDWQSETNRICMKQNSMWNEKYADFLNDKKSWLNSVAVQSTDYGNMNVLKNFGKLTCGAIAAAGADILIGGISGTSFDTDSILDDVIDLTLLSSLLENAESLNGSIRDADTVLFIQSGPDKFNSSESLQTIKDFQAVRNEEYEKRLALIEFNQLIEKVEIAERNFVKTVEDANEDVCSGIHKTMRKDGYILNGGRYERNLVIGATLNDYIYEEGYVSKYKYYSPQNVDFSDELEEAEGSY